VSADFLGNMLKVIIPAQLANDWINTNEVGIESYVDLKGKEKLHLLIEKDFPCKDRPEEDKSDTFTELVNDPTDSC